MSDKSDWEEFGHKTTKRIGATKVIIIVTLFREYILVSDIDNDDLKCDVMGQNQSHVTKHETAQI